MKIFVIIGLLVVVGIVWAGIRLDGRHVEQARVAQAENAPLRAENERLGDCNRDMKHRNAVLAETNAVMKAKIARVTRQ